MHESIKSLLAVVFIVSTVAAALGWADAVGNVPDAVNPTLKYAGTTISILSLVSLLKLHYRRDKAPDFLSIQRRPFFNRDGFCFNGSIADRDGVCLLVIYFQNQFSGPCVGRVAFRPARNFFLGRVKIETFAFEIECRPGGFGVATLPIGVPKPFQGQKQWFEVGASVTYPEGRGRQLRFRDGTWLRTNSNFGNTFATGLMVAGAMSGQIVLSTPVKVRIDLPNNVLEVLDESNSVTSIENLWVLGDPLPG